MTPLLCPTCPCRDEIIELRKRVVEISLAWFMAQEDLPSRIPHLGRVGETAEQWNKRRD